MINFNVALTFKQAEFVSIKKTEGVLYIRKILRIYSGQIRKILKY